MTIFTVMMTKYMCSELVKALNNAKSLIDFTFFGTVTIYRNVHSIKRVVSDVGSYFEIDCDDCKKMMNRN